MALGWEGVRVNEGVCKWVGEQEVVKELVRVGVIFAEQVWLALVLWVAVQEPVGAKESDWVADWVGEWLALGEGEQEWD